MVHPQVHPLPIDLSPVPISDIVSSLICSRVRKSPPHFGQVLA